MLQQRSRNPSCTKHYGLWIPGTSNSGHTHHQCDQGKWNWWVVGFLEWIKDGLIVGLLACRTFDSERNCCKPNIESDWLEWSSQNDKEGRDEYCFIQNNTWPNENTPSGKQHAYNDSIPERGWWTPLPSQLKCSEYVHQSDFWEQAVTVVVKNLMAIPITITMGVKVTQMVAANVVLPVELTPGTLERLYEIQSIQWTRKMVEWMKELVFQQLGLSGLDNWSDRDQWLSELC